MGGNARRKRAKRQKAEQRVRRSASGHVTRIDGPEGTAFRSTGPAAREIQAEMNANRAAFRAQFGRDPGPEDPLVWDPDEAEPVPLSVVKIESEVVDAMQRAGLPPAFIYAYQQTGLIVTEENVSLLDDADLAEWNEAIERYEVPGGTDL